jgi:hypothetical protein
MDVPTKPIFEQKRHKKWGLHNLKPSGPFWLFIGY